MLARQYAVLRLVASWKTDNRANEANNAHAELLQVVGAD